MFYWQITKYDPENRDATGVYLKNEWTDYGEVGRTFDGKKLTFAEYLEVEAKYIQAVLLFMECLDIDSLKVIKLIHRARYQKKALIDGKKIINDTYCNYEMIVFLVQAVLRNKVGCMLALDDKMYVHFGWDYYMYIGSSKACKSTIKKNSRTDFLLKSQCGNSFLKKKMMNRTAKPLRYFQKIGV